MGAVSRCWAWGTISAMPTNREAVSQPSPGVASPRAHPWGTISVMPTNREAVSQPSPGVASRRAHPGARYPRCRPTAKRFHNPAQGSRVGERTLGHDIRDADQPRSGFTTQPRVASPRAHPGARYPRCKPTAKRFHNPAQGRESASAPWGTISAMQTNREAVSQPSPGVASPRAHPG
jgi:hypothetical protein